MLKSRVFTIPIHRRYAEVYGLLSEPTNISRWGGTEPGTEMVHLGGSDYRVQLPRGVRVMRFTPPNEFGVLDYQVFLEGEAGGPTTPVRLHPNQDGCELTFTW
ncbi:MAG: SRPBCC family protein, partial [Hyphomicrobiales bacterium]